jgi:pimeloyl-ACP methyl ester carboxylesterase
MSGAGFAVWFTGSIALAAEPELHRVVTDDGAEVVLARYATPGAPVVLLCHGISSNARFWDLAPERSLAVDLHDRGYDVWNLDLRGHGLAERRGDRRRQRAGWTVDDYALHDLPAAIGEIRAASNQPVHYVGHSMGGMVLAVYLVNHPDPGLASATVVGSPLDFRDPDFATGAMLRVAPFATAMASLPSPYAARWLARFDTRSPLHIDEMLYVPESYTPAARRLMLRTVVSPLSRGELRQLARARSGEFVSADGSVRYREALAGVRLPMLFLAGRADHVVNPDRVRGYFDAVGSSDKAFVVLSEANGFSADYGHLDFGDADHAKDEVFPMIAVWIADHPGHP